MTLKGNGTQFRRTSLNILITIKICQRQTAIKNHIATLAVNGMMTEILACYTMKLKYVLDVNLGLCASLQKTVYSVAK